MKHTIAALLMCTFITSPCLAAAQTVALGGRHSLAIRNDGSILAWGDNLQGQLGDGTGNGLKDSSANTRTTPTALPLPTPTTRFVAVAAGDSHSLALDATGVVWAWGNNAAGQIGDGSHGNVAVLPKAVAGLPKIKLIAAGNGYSIAIDVNGVGWAWGRNDLGQLGNGGNGVGDSCAEFGANNVRNSCPVKIAFPAGVVIQAVSARCYDHCLAVDSNGTVWGWGNPDLGVLGNGSAQQFDAPVESVVVKEPAQDVAVGVNHSLALLKSGAVVSWGDNSYGQLGDGTQDATDVDTACAVRGSVDPLATEKCTALPVGKISAIAAGRFSSYALSSGNLLAWGDNSSAQIGDGGDMLRLLPATVSAIKKIAAVSAGDMHVMASATDSALLYAWGDNAAGQLGNGAYASQPTPKYVVAPGLQNALSLNLGSIFQVDRNLLPPFLLAAELAGKVSKATLDLSVNLKGNTFAASQKLFVAVFGSGVRAVFQADIAFRNQANSWKPFRGAEIPAFLDTFSGDTEQIAKARIFANEDLSQFDGSYAYVGFGSSADDMVASGRYRCLFKIDGAAFAACPNLQ